MTRFRTYLVFIFIMGNATMTYAQQIEIALRYSDTSSTQCLARRCDDTAIIKHTPYNSYSNWSLRRIAYYNLQATYENTPQTVERKKAFREFVKRYALDTSYLTRKKIPGNFIYLFTAIDNVGNKHVIIDANNDHDFGNDHEYVFSPSNKTCPILDASIAYYDGREIKKANVLLQIDPFTSILSDDRYKNEIEKKLDVTINILQKNSSGIFAINNRQFKMNIFNRDELHPRSSFDLNIQPLPLKAGNNNDYKYKNTDTIQIAGGFYCVNSLTRDNLVLNYLGKSRGNGAETGAIAPEISSVDIESAQHFDLKVKSDKYKLIDFWGTWCVPCLRLIPEVKKMHDKYQDRIQFVSVAYDKASDINKIKEAIARNGINWVQLLDDKNKKNSIVNRYKVNEFPTCILINPDGEVVYRGTGFDGLKGLFSFFDSMPNF